MLNLRLYWNTLKYLRKEQILYRLYYLFKRKIGLDKRKKTFPHNLLVFPLKLETFIKYPNAYFPGNRFRFLNEEVTFKDIDWNFDKFGKLWNYNLNYFSFLNQENIEKKEGLRLIKDFLKKWKTVESGMEPYPISLRIVNWIKFLNKHKVKDKTIINSLYAQCYVLMENLEYHLLGNHLLENGFALLWGAYYFRDNTLYQKAKEILTRELGEQILSDGAHFELSPMYHQIMTERILDAINLVKNNNWKNYELLEFLKEKAQLMLSWLKNITFANGNIPLFNDSCFGIAPQTNILLNYAKRLGLEQKTIPLGESGYRLIRKKRYEIAIDIANVKANYIPGHTHADTFTFELYVDTKPFIVDVGVSTYENNERRLYERSTKAHNTVEVNQENSSEVWGSFRLGERARVKELKESRDYIKALHDGYFKKFGLFHQREFIFKETCIVIRDKILGNNNLPPIARLHFHPSVKVKPKDGLIVCEGLGKIRIKGGKFRIRDYHYAPEFNKLLPAKCVEIKFNKELECRIEL